MSGPLSQREAARVWSLSRATMHRAIKSGKLSLTTDKQVDPAEMLRVFGEPGQRGAKPAMPHEAGADAAALLVENALLKAQLEAKCEMVEAMKQNLTDLRSQVQMLSHDRAEPVRKRWWSR